MTKMENQKDVLKEAELEKLYSETSRNIAEQKKLLSETKEIEKRISQKVFKADSVVKAVMGGIVAAALFTAWFIGYMQPLLEVDTQVAKSKNELLNAQNELIIAKNEEQLELYRHDSIALNATRLVTVELRKSSTRDLQALKDQNDTLRAQQSQSGKLIEDLQGRLNHIAKEYQKLSVEKQSTQAEKSRYAKLAKDASSESDRLKDQLAKINVAKQETEDRSTDISAKIISNWLMENMWTVEFSGWGEDIEKRKWKFEEKGKLIDMAEPNVINSWEITDGTLVIRMGNGMATYTAKVSGAKITIEGAASNRKGKNWSWKMKVIGSKL